MDRERNLEIMSVFGGVIISNVTYLPNYVHHGHGDLKRGSVFG